MTLPALSTYAIRLPSGAHEAWPMFPV